MRMAYTVLPLAKSHFNLSAQEFWDAMAIRYRKPLRGIPDWCNGCSSSFSLSHALSCRTGGLVNQHHNEVCDAIGDLASLVWNQVKCKPIVREADSETGTPALVVDLAVRGVWSPQTEALFDIMVIDTDARSYSNQLPKGVLWCVLWSAENEKKKKYLDAHEERQGLFTPICYSVEGMSANKAEVS